MSKQKISIIGALFFTLLFYFFWWNNPLLSYFDYKLFDRLTQSFPSAHNPDSTVVIEIDDKSLNALGQWPWPRIITAKLIETLHDAQPAAIVLDMVFSEKDRTSPSSLAQFYASHWDLNLTIHGLPQSLQDNDLLLANALSDAPMVFPLFSNSAVQNTLCKLPHSVTYETNNHVIYPLNDLVCNLPMFQHKEQPIGHIHAAADSDGIFRRLPLVMEHQEVWIPALGLAALASSDIHFDNVSPLLGEMRVTVNQKSFLVDQYAEALLNFYPFERYQTVSAIDILNGSINLETLKGKYLFIGSTALGLDSTYTMSDGSVRSGVFIHATLVENILNNDLGVQVSSYKLLNLALSLAIAFILMIQMIRKRYLSVVVIFFSSVIILLAATAIAWHYHIYLSSGYLIIPLTAYVFILALLMFVIDYYTKKRFIDALNDAKREREQLQSALHQSESEIQYQKAMVLQQGKLAAMGEMIDNIAHQWRQPLSLLAMIIQHSEFAFMRGKVDIDYIRKMSADSMEQILFMSQTIDDFRNFVKPDREEIAFSLNEPIEESLRLLSGMFSANGIMIHTHYCDQPLTIMGSPSELKQVIINLLQNSRDALIEKQVSYPQIHIHLSSIEENASITITDNGGGISSDTMKHIFEPYFTTKPEGIGSGIGLYICDAIIRNKMQGNIIPSNTEDGTRFTITLPLRHS